MIEYNDIKNVEIELSSFCNANCPLCPRSLFGYPYNDGYIAKNLSLNEIKKIFTTDFVTQLDVIRFEGNFGDPLMNPELLDIVRWFNTHCDIFTNASLQTETFWKELAIEDVTVNFAIDGLEDTHSIYRQDTDYNKVIKNAQTFINNGGNAVWKMLEFEHNKHQIEECRRLSKELGFSEFSVKKNQRTGPVYDKQGNLLRVIGDLPDWQPTELSHFISVTKGDMFLEDIILDKPKTTISCRTIKNSSIYISSEGEVYPCCYMGFNPRKYGKGRWHQPVNKQIQNLLQPNNAIERPLQECIEWFNKIPACWNKKTYKDGRLIVCDSACGK